MKTRPTLASAKGDAPHRRRIVPDARRGLTARAAPSLPQWVQAFPGERRDTSFNSARLNSVFAFPLSGRAPYTLRWEDSASGYFARMEHTGIVKSMKDFYGTSAPSRSTERRFINEAPLGSLRVSQ